MPPEELGDRGVPGPRGWGLSPWQLEAGALNSICDVGGVRVGHRTLREDTPFAIRTGVTVVLPEANMPEECLPAAAVVFNGSGEMTGFHQINEWGLMETPIALTGTAAVPTVLQGLSDYMFSQSSALGETREPCLPVVAECDDMWLSDTRHSPLVPAHVGEAIEAARADQKEWGAVGAGTGMVSFGFKGGIGSASRKLWVAGTTHHLGAICLVNFGSPGDLVVAGTQLGHLPGEIDRGRAQPSPPGGSLIVVLATDAPLGHLQLRRLAQRAALGMARVGSYGSHGSGDLFLAFSTCGVREDEAPPWSPQPVLRSDLLNEFFRAAVEATEEGILNALFRAESQTGFQGRTVVAVPHQEVRSRLQLAGHPVR